VALLLTPGSAQGTAVALLTGHLQLLARPRSFDLSEGRRDTCWENGKVKQINYLPGANSSLCWFFQTWFFKFSPTVELFE